MLTQPQLILASSSPSRKMILDTLGIPYDIQIPHIQEDVHLHETPEEHVLRLSKEKAVAIANRINHDVTALIIGCDSVCVLKGEIVSKPETHDRAVAQLQAASGQCVYFYSGLSLYNTKTNHLQQEVVCTQVYFKKLSQALIEAYLEKDKPYHCAGSLRAEGLGIILIEKLVSEDPNSLIGLPLIALIRLLEKEKVDIVPCCVPFKSH